MVSKKWSIQRFVVIVICILGAASEDIIITDEESEMESNFIARSNLHCFNCDSLMDKNCDKLKPPYDARHPYLQVCPAGRGPLPFCQKIVVKKSVGPNMDRVIRKCGWLMHSPPHCSENVYEIDCQCFEPGCNGSSSLHLDYLGILVSLVGLIVFHGLGH